MVATVVAVVVCNKRESFSLELRTMEESGRHQVIVALSSV